MPAPTARLCVARFMGQMRDHLTGTRFSALGCRTDSETLLRGLLRAPLRQQLQRPLKADEPAVRRMSLFVPSGFVAPSRSLRRGEAGEQRNPTRPDAVDQVIGTERNCRS